MLEKQLVNINGLHNLKALIRALIKIENVYLNKRMEMGSFRFGSHAAEKKVTLLFNLTKKTVSAALMEKGARC